MRLFRSNLASLALAAGLLCLGFTAPADAQLATLVADLKDDATAFPPDRQPKNFVRVGTRLLFEAGSPEGEGLLWVTDGTPDGTMELCLEGCRNLTLFPVTLGDQALFLASTAFNAQQALWVTDGTRGGTRPLIGGGDGVTFPGFYGDEQTARAIGDRIVFRAFTAEHGNELWTTDGTREGTHRVADMTPGREGTVLWFLARFRGRLVFHAFTRDTALWWTDGTPEGTERLVSLPAGSDARFAETLPGASGEVLVYGARQGGGLHLAFSDGTPEGTRLYEAPTGGLLRMESYGFQREGNRLYFTADDGETGDEVWMTDGSSGGTRAVTRLAEENAFVPTNGAYLLRPLPGSSDVAFLAQDGTGAWELYVTGGSPASTRRLLKPCEADDFACRVWTHLSEADGAALLLYDSPAEGPTLVRVAGTRSTDVRRQSLCPGAPSSCQVAVTNSAEPALISVPEASSAPHLWLRQGRRADLWRSDGTRAGTEQVTDFLRPVNAPALYDRSLAFLPSAGLLVSTEPGRPPNDVGPRALWRVPPGSDTPAPLLILRDVWDGAAPSDLTPFGQALAFSVCEDHERDFHLTLGTPDSTLSLGARGEENVCDSSEARMVRAGSSVVFQIRVRSGGLRNEIWTSDGTAGSALPLFRETDDVRLDTETLTAFGGTAYFGTHGRQDVPDQIWRTDGTLGGTEVILDLPELGEEELVELRAVGDRLYFVTERDRSAVQLWWSDGTKDHAVRLGSVPALTNLLFRAERLGDLLLSWQSSSRVDSFWIAGSAADSLEEVVSLREAGIWTVVPDPANGVAYILTECACDGAPEARLFRFDAASREVQLLRTVALDDRERRFGSERGAVYDGRFFFALLTPDRGDELWMSDGTAEGTQPFADLVAGPGSSFPRNLTATGEGLFFSAQHAFLGRELWRTDGTLAGIRFVHDINPGWQDSDPGPFVAAGDRLYFTADDGYRGRELWSLDLTDPPGVCVPAGRELCLRGTDYRATLGWFDRDGNSAQALTRPLTSDTGAFYYRNPDNLETVVKILDGRPINDHLWTFLASLSNVEYVLDITHAETGISRRYRNPRGNFASFGDTFAFGPNGTPLDLDAALAALETGAEPTAARSTYEVNLGEVAPGDGSPWRVAQSYSERRIAPRSCAPAAERLCLQGGRFAVEVDWRDFRDRTGAGTAVPLTADTGYFWFFDDANVELILKVLDGTELNGNFWVFYGALSNVEYTLTVTDTEEGVERTYFNPLRSFASVGDTGAFPR